MDRMSGRPADVADGTTNPDIVASAMARLDMVLWRHGNQYLISGRESVGQPEKAIAIDKAIPTALMKRGWLVKAPELVGGRQVFLLTAEGRRRAR